MNEKIFPLILNDLKGPWKFVDEEACAAITKENNSLVAEVAYDLLSYSDRIYEYI